jgi:hypothetical protein
MQEKVLEKVLEKVKSSELYQEQFESLIVQITNIFQLSSIESEKLKNT